MSDWQKGDLALSIHTWQHRDPDGTAPDAGAVHEVSRLYTDQYGTWLIFDKWPESDWYAPHFRKVTPKKPDIYDQGIITLMNRKPVEA